MDFPFSLRLRRNLEYGKRWFFLTLRIADYSEYQKAILFLKKQAIVLNFIKTTLKGYLKSD